MDTQELSGTNILNTVITGPSGLLLQISACNQNHLPGCQCWRQTWVSINEQWVWDPALAAQYPGQRS